MNVQLAGSFSIVRCMKEVNLRPARLILGWVNNFRWVYHLGMQSSQLGQLSLASIRGR